MRLNYCKKCIYFSKTKDIYSHSLAQKTSVGSCAANSLNEVNESYLCNKFKQK